MKRTSTGRVAALALSALTLTACPKRPDAAEGSPASDGSDTSTGEHPPSHARQTIRRDGRADDALSAARQKSSGLPKRQASEAYFAVWKAYPATTSGEEALYEAGTLSYDAGDYASARKDFNELLFENPLFEKANDAKRKLGIAALETRAYRDAYQTLSSLAEKASGEDRRNLLDSAGKAAEGGQLWGPSLQIALNAVQDAPTPEERQAALTRVSELVESKVPFVDVAKAQADLAPTHPAWPILTFKLGRIYYHLRDWTNLQTTLQRFLAQAPEHPYAAQAQEMLARANQTGRVKPRTVGVVLPLSGNYKVVGEAALRGIQLALKGSDVELVVKDTRGDVSQAAKAMEELALDSGAVAVIGPMVGDESKRAAVAAEELGVPLLTLTRLEGITALGSYVFRNMLTYSAQTKALTDYGQAVGFRSYGILYPNAPFGKEFASDFWNDVVQRGGTIRAAESYSNDQTTFTTEAQKLVGRYYRDDRRDFIEARQAIAGTVADSFHKRKLYEKAKSSLEPIVDFDALFIPDDWQRVGLVAPALAVEDIITNACDNREIEKLKKTTGRNDIKTVTLLGVSTWTPSGNPKNADGVYKLLEKGGKFVVCSVYVDGFFVDSPRPATRRFVKLYEDAYKDLPPPGIYEAMAYDSAKMVRQVVDGKRPQTREAFREALSTLKNFDGATGKTSFTDKREPERNLFLLTVDNKGIHELSPDKVNGT